MSDPKLPTPTGLTAVAKPKRKSNPLRGSKPGEKRGGRKPGTPNKVTQEFRDTVRQLLEDNATNVAKWLTQVAHGVPATDEKGQPVHGMWLQAPDPDKALQRLCGLAEYAAPKLARTEVVGDGGGAVKIEASAMLKLDPQAATDAYRAALGK